MSVSTTTPGLHDLVKDKLKHGFFPSAEEELVRKLAVEWYVTRIGKLSIGNTSRYRFALMKPTQSFQEMFNLERELVVIFSSYNSFEPRSLDAFDAVIKQFQKLRLEKVCYIFFSRDNCIESKVQDLLKTNQESQVVIPLSYSEYSLSKDSFLMKNKFRSFFYSRDLFAFESPLKKDLYFFGRNDVVHRIVNRHKANENSGLFGLRKTGKTSIIHGVKRTLEAENGICVIIDCQSPAFHMRRWNESLHYILMETIAQCNLKISIPSSDKFTEVDSAIIFEQELIKIRKLLHNKPILLVFDEVENITFGVSPSEHWEKKLDFVFLWQTLRSIFQKHNTLLSYLIVGTNPLSVEQARILGKDNPIFNSVPFEYIERFNIQQTREMVKKLGSFMGLIFDEALYSKLTEDYGGHPFLIRHLCSLINSMDKTERPIEISRLLYEKAKNEFDAKYIDYLDMILEVLREFYNEEYKMLEYLALGDYDTFKKHAVQSNSLTNHLKGYGIIEETREGYDFKIDAVKTFLIQKNQYRKVGLSNEQKQQEISLRRNQLEPNLRKIIRLQLKAEYGENNAKDKVLNYFGGSRKNKYSVMTYRELFDPNKVEIYYEDLRIIINKEWSVFEHIFSRNREKFNLNMEYVNKYRTDAHAKDISDEDFTWFRVCVKWLEEHTDDFLD
ncbi:hypothetical protein [Paenibacillus campi]|uniref:hypothetical protein n=1 Tax=Paenibacillus campi TaxID=3106031 RepID=UPI002AFDFC30|nr:hypothetical protein [Paenibacillus sp. SGZ-1014]